jgi:ubiquitin C-terminal hydrolase
MDGGVHGGLHNLGQSCAINSVIQLITHIKTLRDGIASKYKDMSQNTVTWQLWDIINKIYVERHDVAPAGLLKTLATFFPNDIQLGEQQDICELWLLISSKIAEEIATVSVSQPDRSGLIDVTLSSLGTYEQHIKDRVETTLKKVYDKSISEWILSILCVQLSIVQCQACGHQEWNPEFLTSIQLDIPRIRQDKEMVSESPNNVHNIEDLLLRNYAVEVLEDWTCDKCKVDLQSVKCGAKKQNKMYSMPPVLMISLKRFRMLQNGMLSKAHEPVNISDSIVFETNGSTVKYLLKGLGNHFGAYGGGHYNVVVKHDNENSWVCYDDIHRSILSNNTFLHNNSDAYILCYELA